MIHKYKSIPNIISVIQGNPKYMIPKDFGTLYLQTREYFDHPIVFSISQINLNLFPPNFQNLENYLVHKHDFKKENVQEKMPQGNTSLRHTGFN